MKKYLLLVIISILLLTGCNNSETEILENNKNDVDKTDSEYSFFTLNSIHSDITSNDGESYYFSDNNIYFWNSADDKDVLATSGTWEIVDNQLILKEKYNLCMISGEKIGDNVVSGETKNNLVNNNILLMESDNHIIKDIKYKGISKYFNNSYEYEMDGKVWITSVVKELKWVDELKLQIVKNYLKLEKTALKELLALNGEDSIYEFKESLIKELGRIKLGDFEYTLVFSKKKEDSSLKLYLSNENNKEIELFSEDSLYTMGDTELTIFNDKYLIITRINPFNDGVNSTLIILDENGNRILNKDIYYEAKESKFDYNILEDKITYSAYEWLPRDRKILYNIDEKFNLYRVYYEIIEEDGFLRTNRTMEDFTDYTMTAAVQ